MKKIIFLRPMKVTLQKIVLGLVVLLSSQAFYAADSTPPPPTPPPPPGLPIDGGLFILFSMALVLGYFASKKYIASKKSSF